MNGLKLDSCVDTAVIGAGVAGLYSAFRLLTSESVGTCRSSISIFEADSEIGGRVKTFNFRPNGPSCELGAMRYLSNQKLLHSLVERVFADKYGVRSKDFPEINDCNTAMYLRSNIFRGNALEKERTKIFPELSHENRWDGMSSDEILNAIFADVLQADGYSLQETFGKAKISREALNHVKKHARYRFSGKFQNKFLYEISLAELLTDRLGEKMSEFIRSVDGFNSTYDWPATDGIEFANEFAVQTQYKSIEGGMGQLTSCLEREIIDMGGQIYTGIALTDIYACKDSLHGYRYQLRFRKVESGEMKIVYTNNIMLCIPSKALKKIVFDPSLFSPRSIDRSYLDELFDSVTAISVAKIVLEFRKPWWKESLGYSAKTITDLPLRQSFYFGEDEKSSSSNIVLAAYIDGKACDFWKKLHEKFDRDHQSIQYVSEKKREKEVRKSAPPEIVHEAVKMLQLVHGQNVSVPKPSRAAFVDWDDWPHGGGYHGWKPGTHVWKVAPLIRCPIEGHRIFIAGEAYSDQQAWIEGALCTAEQILRQFFSLKTPKWLEGENGREYYLGW